MNKVLVNVSDMLQVLLNIASNLTLSRWSADCFI